MFTGLVTSDEVDCALGWFPCASTNSCVEQQQICDGIEDCDDGHDERMCGRYMYLQLHLLTCWRKQMPPYSFGRDKRHLTYFVMPKQTWGGWDLERNWKIMFICCGIKILIYDPLYNVRLQVEKYYSLLHCSVRFQRCQQFGWLTTWPLMPARSSNLVTADYILYAPYTHDTSNQVFILLPNII